MIDVRASRSWRSALISVGLALTAVVIGPAMALGQVIPPPDSIPKRDTLPTRDTLPIAVPSRAGSVPGDSMAAGGEGGRDTVKVPLDTIKPPLATAPIPDGNSVGPGYDWDRDAIFASGAHTLLDLLEHVPGVSGLRVGWLLPPESAAYDGAFGRIRVFLDGIELAPILPRTDGLFDLSTIELWPLERVQVVRGAGELRVHLRSWRVRSTTPSTRTDVATGQYRTNIFRGYFGRRLSHGEALQFGFQQFSTGDSQHGGDGDQLSLMGRVGWTVGQWSMDAYGTRRSRTVTELLRRDGLPNLPGQAGSQLFGYVRVGYRTPDADGTWFQAMASHDGYSETAEDSPAAPPADSTDSSISRPQYIVSGGWNHGALSLVAIGRYSMLNGDGYLSPVIRGEFDTRWGSLAARAERRAEDSTTRAELVVQAHPLPWVSAVAAASQTRSDGNETGSVTAVRGELGVLLGRTWLIGGALRSGDVPTGAPVVFDPAFVSSSNGSAMAIYAGARGPVWRDLRADVLVTTWTGGNAEEGSYRPTRQAQGSLTLDTRWLSRFPTGQFGLLATGGIAYRSAVRFPTGGEASLRTLGSTIASARLEITIQQVVAFVESRNTMGAQYELVPGFVMPRNVLLYGVRWQFWN